MDPLIRDQIKHLQASNDPRDHSMATILEVLVEVREDARETKVQTQRTNGRVTSLESKVSGLAQTEAKVADLERKHAGVVSCPGKCIDLEVQLLEAIAKVEAQEDRLVKLEEPVKVRGAIWHGIVSSFTGVSAVLAVVFGFLYIPGVSDRLFSHRDVAIEHAVSKAVAEEMSAHHEPSPPPAEKH